MLRYFILVVAVLLDPAVVLLALAYIGSECVFVILAVRLQPTEARASMAMCRRLGFADAQYPLTGACNINPSRLCEAGTTVLNAVSRMPAQTTAGPIVAAESQTYVTVALVID